VSGVATGKTSHGPSPRLGAWFVALYVLGMLLALALDAYEPLFLGLGVRGGQGTDFFCVPKAYLNLWAGHSAFDTWSAPAYGPYATWFVLHPAVALWIGGPLAWLPPWIAYGAFVLLTLGMLALCAALLSHHATPGWSRVLVWGALLASPITYWLLFVGNVHGVLLVAVALLLTGLLELSRPEQPVALGLSARWKVGAGLLLSLLSKPLLVLLVPALLLLRATRRPVLSALAIYGLLSAAFLAVPALNPEPMGWARLWEVSTSPSWVQQHLNIYTNHFQLTAEMRDNAMHWLHMVAQSGFAWDHPQILSLPSLLRGLTGKTYPLQWLALLPALLSPLLLLVRQESERARLGLWLLLLALASHFLAYAVAWEYQYSQLLVVSAALWALPELLGPRWRWPLLAALATLNLPSLYPLLSSGGFSAGEVAALRAWRVVPALLLALVACVRSFSLAWHGAAERRRVARSA